MKTTRYLPLEDWLCKYTIANQKTGCREFIGYKNACGYGSITMGCKPWLAHRYVWYLIHGGFEKPEVLHHCDNPPCCEPSHLWNGTQAENNADRTQKGRSAHLTGDLNISRKRPECLMRGEMVNTAVLTEDAVREIRRRYVRACGMRVKNGARDLAEEFGVKCNTITAITRGEIWRHVH